MVENKIKEYRVKAGISQTELARRVKIAAQNLSAIERGKLEAWPKAKKQISKALKVSENELFPRGAEVC